MHPTRRQHLHAIGRAMRKAGNIPLSHTPCLTTSNVLSPETASALPALRLRSSASRSAASVRLAASARLARSSSAERSAL